MEVYDIPEEAARQMTQMRHKFNKLDKNKDGWLDFAELKALLKRGNPSISSREVRALFNNVDKNQDGVIEFGEFLRFIFGTDDGIQHIPATPDVVSVFQIYAGGAKDLDGRSFAKLVRDCYLLDRNLAAPDVDIIFDKVKGKGERKIGLAQFEQALARLADRKGWRTEELMEAIGDANGPLLLGTKANSVRFHDDKTTYTGRAAHPDGPSEELLQLGDLPALPPERRGLGAWSKSPQNSGRRGGNHGYSAARSNVPTRCPPLHPIHNEDVVEWNQWEDAFYAFAGRSGEMTLKEFGKLCQELQLLGKGFNLLDIDMVFWKACVDGKKRIDFHGFQELMREVAERRKMSLPALQDLVHAGAGRAYINQYQQVIHHHHAA